MGKGKNLSKRRYSLKKLSLELFVVFLGVTAGFILNNRRNQQQKKTLEHKYLSGFLQDVDKNIEELETTLNSDSLWLEHANPLLISLQEGSISIDSAESAMKMVISISSIDLHTSTYENISNSGNLNILSNFHLKSTIVDYHIAIKGIEFFDDTFYKYLTDFVLPFLLSEFNVLGGEFRGPEIIHSTRFSNIIAGYYSLIQQKISIYQKVLTESYLLRDELKKNIHTERK